MRSKALNASGERSFALVFDTGDEPVSLLERFAASHNVRAARVHAHGGHLLEAKVRPTLEVMLIESPSALMRRHDPQSGLALIRIP